MSVTQKKGKPHIGLVADVLDMLDRMMVNRQRDVEFLVETAQNIGGNVEVSFDLAGNEYNTFVSIGNKLRHLMSQQEEYRWDFLMTMLYEDLYVDEHGNDTRLEVEDK